MPIINIPPELVEKERLKDWPHPIREEIVRELVNEAIQNLIKKFPIKTKSKSKSNPSKRKIMTQSDDQIRELIKHMLSELAVNMKKLSKWESDFIESISDQFDKKGSLSPKQRDVLERIYNDRI